MTMEIWHGRDHNGTRSMSVSIMRDGDLVLDGQDIGPSVAVFGEGLTEYEWEWEVNGVDVPRIAHALGRPPREDPIEALRHWMVANGGRDPGVELQKAGLDIEFRSRIR